MRRLVVMVLVAGPLLKPNVAIAADKGWAAFSEERRGECVGPEGQLEVPIEIEAGKRKYRLEGARLVESTHDKDHILRVGIISATKDDRPETLSAIAIMIKRLQNRKMDVLLANGDLATDEFEMESVFPALAAAKVLVVAIIGNTESCGSFNKIANDTFAKHPNFINGNWVRRLELDDGTFITLPGYHDRKFTHTSGAAVYDADDIRSLEALAKNPPEPLILVSHGPPRMRGRAALDVITDGQNVGSTMMTDVLHDLKIRFGLFGHILESGGRGTDLSGKKKVRQRKWNPTLYVNAGTLNPDPWPMNDRTTSYGMAMLVEIDRRRARYFVEKLKRP